MLGGTNHRHLDITFRWVEGEPPTNEPPVATFSHDASGLQVTFDAQESHDPDGEVVAYDWDFGDGTRGVGQTPNHIYTGSGSYQVTLTVTDDDGATSKMTRPVTVALTNDEARQKIEQAQALLAEAMALLDEALELL
jgi:PKD repeat protein